MQRRNRTKRRLIRICIVAPSRRMVGGQSTSAALLKDRLENNTELDVHFVPIDPRLPSIFAVFQSVKVLRTVVTSTLYVLLLLFRIPRVDVVHAFSASYWSFLLAPVPAMLVARLFGKKVILNYRSGEADDHLTKWRSAKPLCRLAHAIVVPSDYLVDVFKKHGLMAQSIPNFVDVSRLPFRLRTPLRPIFLSNRNFEPHYNISGVLRAFRKIQAEWPAAELIVVGDGPLRNDLLRECKELGLRNTSFLGFVTAEVMASLYDKAEVCLNAPYVDNMPNTLLEAAACGLPIVSTDAGGIPYIVTNNVTAILVRCNDDDALADAAISLLENPHVASKIAAAARVEVLERYCWAAVQSLWVQHYRATAFNTLE